MTVDPSDPTRFDFTGGHIRFSKWDQPHSFSRFDEVDLSGNIREFVESSVTGNFEHPTAGYAWQPPTSFTYTGVYPYQAAATLADGTVLRVKSDIEASRKVGQLRMDA